MWQVHAYKYQYINYNKKALYLVSRATGKCQSILSFFFKPETWKTAKEMSSHTGLKVHHRCVSIHSLSDSVTYNWIFENIFEMIDIGFVKYDLIKISTSCVSWPVCRRKLVCRGKLPYYLAQCALVRLTVLAARSQAKLFNPPLLCGNSVCFLTF